MANWDPYGGGGGGGRGELENMFCSSNYKKMDNYYMEKRRVFLRSYQFSRKRSFLQKLKLSLLIPACRRLLLAKKMMRVSVIKLKRLVWLKLKLRLGLGYQHPHRGSYRFHFHPLIIANYSCSGSDAVAPTASY